MCYLYLKLRIYFERKFQPKSVLKRIVSFILYSIDKSIDKSQTNSTKMHEVFPNKKET